MAAINWGLLAKSLVDNETVEEAIARLIAEHNEDETAHLGTGQSLQSHKASEIIDHVVDSIIADKIREREIGVTKLRRDRFLVECFFESLDGYNIFLDGLAELVPDLAYLFMTTGPNGGGFAGVGAGNDTFDWAKNPESEVSLKINQTTLQDATWGIGGNGVGDIVPTGECAIFWLKNNLLYARTQTTGGDDETYIADVDVTIPHIYRIKITSGEKVEYFIDDVLVVTHDDYLGTGTEGNMFFFQIRNGEAEAKEMIVFWANFIQDW